MTNLNPTTRTFPRSLEEAFPENFYDIQRYRNWESVEKHDYSLADIDIAPFVHRLIRCELFHLVEARPRVADWYARISSRPAFAQAIPPAGSEGVQPQAG